METSLLVKETQIITIENLNAIIQQHFLMDNKFSAFQLRSRAMFQQVFEG